MNPRAIGEFMKGYLKQIEPIAPTASLVISAQSVVFIDWMICEPALFQAGHRVTRVGLWKMFKGEYRFDEWIEAPIDENAARALFAAWWTDLGDRIMQEVKVS